MARVRNVAKTDFPSLRVFQDVLHNVHAEGSLQFCRRAIQTVPTDVRHAARKDGSPRNQVQAWRSYASRVCEALEEPQATSPADVEAVRLFGKHIQPLPTALNCVAVLFFPILSSTALLRCSSPPIHNGPWQDRFYIKRVSALPLKAVGKDAPPPQDTTCSTVSEFGERLCDCTLMG